MLLLKCIHLEVERVLVPLPDCTPIVCRKTGAAQLKQAKAEYAKLQ